MLPCAYTPCHETGNGTGTPSILKFAAGGKEPLI